IHRLRRGLPGVSTRPVIPINARTLRITAAAGTELAGASSGEVYDPKAFVPHMASLRQGFPHCAIFPPAASRRSLGRVPVPVWLVILSDQLFIVALVSHYLTN
ncbi:PG1 protein, partial [Aduncisulcus paluster]